MIFFANSLAAVTNRDRVPLRCPECRQLGIFEPIGDQAVPGRSQSGQIALLGQRRCPNPGCLAHVFVAWSQQGGVVVSYPPQRIDFDASSIPGPVVNAFEEAITCHANTAYIAATIMVRRTLEELCADQGVMGRNLQDRIKALGSKIVLPQGLLDGLDNLRLLGNDAAHVEAKEYRQVGKDEVEVAIDVTKEVLKAVYQYGDLVSRLEKLKVKKSHPGGPT